VAAIDPLLRQELDELTSGVCRAINDPKRLLLLYALRDEARTVTELCEILGTPQANTSQHLAVLRDRGLVKGEQLGNRVRYSLRHPKVIEAINLMRGIMSEELARQSALRPTVA
jgi:ArsR family transcriptional regulator